MKPLGIYVHVPFCIKKCNYCDFYSHPPRDEGEMERYFEALKVPGDEELGGRHFVDTIFFGGGTPSLAEPRHIEGILEKIRASYELAADAEITIECNPETLTAAKLEAYRGMGINRVSIGVQSLDDEVLRRMGRVHDAAKAREAVRMALAAGFNTNCDLIFGAPGQSFESFKAGLDELLGSGIQHISFYSLQIEEGTPFYIDYRFGSLQIPSWEENRRMYHYAVDAVKAAGFHHYEVSNAARPGFECRHNLKYWTMQDYLGIGRGAHSFIGGRRFEGGLPGGANGAQGQGEGFSAQGLGEELGAQGDGEAYGSGLNELKTDFVFTELRLVDGFEKNAYFERFGVPFDTDFGEAAKSLIKDGFLASAGGRVAFTPKGLDNTNSVLEKLINALEE